MPRDIKRDLLRFLYGKRLSLRAEKVNEVFKDCEIRSIDIRYLLRDLKESKIIEVTPEYRKLGDKVAGVEFTPSNVHISAKLTTIGEEFYERKYLKEDLISGNPNSQGKERDHLAETNMVGIVDSKELLDTSHFLVYIDRIKDSVETDPSLAVGSTKELVESTLKTVLTELSIAYDKNADIPNLLKLVQKALKLVPDDIDEKVKGAEHIKVLMSNLGQVIIKIVELRNLYATGHGRVGSKSALKPRHARLVANAGIALSTFLIENFKEQKPEK